MFTLLLARCGTGFDNGCPDYPCKEILIFSYFTTADTQNILTYNPLQGWVQETNSPRNLSGNAIVEYDDNFYATGGITPTASVVDDVYRSSDAIHWEYIGTLPLPLFGHASVVFENKIWVIGGAVGSAYSFYVFSSEDGVNWDEEARLNTERGTMTAQVWNDKIYVVGGQNLSGLFDDMEVYDPDLGSWSTVSAVIPGRTGVRSAASVIHRGSMYLVGGLERIGASETVLDEVRRYETDQFVIVGNLPGVRSGPVLASYRDKLWVIGGTDLTTSTNTVWTSPGGAIWTEEESLPELVGLARGIVKEAD